MALLRRDGFAMDGGDEFEALPTRPELFSGRYLFVNAEAHRGEPYRSVRARIKLPEQPNPLRIH